MAACGLVAVFPVAFWIAVQRAFRRAEPVTSRQLEG